MSYFMINLLESMGAGRDRPREPWISAVTLTTVLRVQFIRFYSKLFEIGRCLFYEWKIWLWFGN